MHTTTSRRRGWRFSRLFAAVTALLLAASGSLVATMAAHADEPGYVGQMSDNETYFDMFGGDRHLALMTAGVPYSDTLTGPDWPEGRSTWCWRVSGTLPDGISMTAPAAMVESATATFAGTPTTAGEEYTFTVEIWDCSDGQPFALEFAVIVESGKHATSAYLEAPAFAPYDNIPLLATISGNPPQETAPTGEVDFSAGGDDLGSGTLNVAGTGTDTVSLTRAAVGSVLFTATYDGDDDFSGSSTTATSHIYAPTAIGTVLWNGVAYSGATVRLYAADDVTLSTPIDTDTPAGDGTYELSPGAITAYDDVIAEYVVQVTFPGDVAVYYLSAGPSTGDSSTATRVTPGSWGASLDVERESPPVWSDSTLATPRVGGSYSDGVAATSPNAVTYTVDDGSLPAGLTLHPETGAVTGTPAECDESCTYDFTIKADNGYGSVTKNFTGTLLPAGTPPTWEDDELPPLRVSVAVDDGVEAVGDPTITYAVSDGTLPAGLVLWPATGAITGTPTAAGPYAFTVTATNAFGSVDAIFEGDVEAAPELDLTLDFQAGTSIEEAGSTISADGLQVGSTYTLTMFSTPRVLYTGTVGASGGFSHLVSLPADTPAGAHKLVLTGTAANGTPMSATAWFSLGTNGKILAISYVGPVGGLAATGAEPTSALFLGGALLLLGVVAVAARRRSTAA